MRLGYSEFSFGYAFTENLIRSSPKAPKGAPIFPNLVQEAQFGYDVQIKFPGRPLFFQYKLPELMKRSDAKEIKTYQLSISTPFFRMPLMRRNLSRQHEKLIELESKFPGAVLYASPELTDLRSFDLAYKSGSVHQRSAFFSPTKIGRLPDNKDHSIAYESGSRVAYFCSEPREINAISYDQLAEIVQHDFVSDRYKVLDNSARELRETVRSLVSREMQGAEADLAERVSARRAIRTAAPPEAPQAERVVQDILVAREMVRVDLGVDLIIAQPKL